MNNSKNRNEDVRPNRGPNSMLIVMDVLLIVTFYRVTINNITLHNPFSLILVRSIKKGERKLNNQSFLSHLVCTILYKHLLLYQRKWNNYSSVLNSAANQRYQSIGGLLLLITFTVFM